MLIRQSFIDGGVSYLHGFVRPGGPLSGFVRLVAPRSVRGEALNASPHQDACVVDT
jgi:hypothetical protein